MHQNWLKSYMYIQVHTLKNQHQNFDVTFSVILGIRLWYGGTLTQITIDLCIGCCLMYHKAKWTNDLPVFCLGALCSYTVCEGVQSYICYNVSTLFGSNTCTLGLMYIHNTYMYHISNSIKAGLISKCHWESILLLMHKRYKITITVKSRVLRRLV